MKNHSYTISGLILVSFLVLLLIYSGCKKEPNPVKYQYGTFPDSVYNLEGINSAYDDYNSTTYLLSGQVPIIFSSNRGSSGGQFDLVNGLITFDFDQTNGNFSLKSEMSTDPFYVTIAQKANTPGDDMGPYASFISSDGYEYLFLASQVSGGQLDLFYERNLPRSGNNIPVVNGPYPVTVLNSQSDDAYYTLDADQDSVYFCSNRGGNFDIYVQKRPDSLTMVNWLNHSYSPSFLVDSLNSSKEDKFPFIYENIMVFASDRDGGLGGFDLYYSIFRNGKWSAPVNFGPGINTSGNEYRPVIGYSQDFTNKFLILSSNRPGGKGGLDLYFTGYDFPN
jgi:hypothetical protein